jgi:hypothetical protein
LKTQKNDKYWPIGMLEAWAGKKPLGCETVHAHVLFRDGDNVWVKVEEGDVSLLGRQMYPCEGPRDVVKSMTNFSVSFPEDKERWVRSVERPPAVAQDGVCHLFIMVSVRGFAPVPERGLHQVPWVELPLYLDEDLQFMLKVAYGIEAVAEVENAA